MADGISNDGENEEHPESGNQTLEEKTEEAPIWHRLKARLGKLALAGVAVVSLSIYVGALTYIIQNRGANNEQVQTYVTATPSPTPAPTPTPVPLSQPWHTLDEQMDFRKAANIYLAFRDLRFQTQLDMRKQGIVDEHLVSDELALKYYNALEKKTIGIPTCSTEQYIQARVEAFNEAFTDEDKNLMTSTLEKILLSNEPYLEAEFGNNGMPQIVIDPSYVGAMAQDQGKIIVSVDSMFDTEAVTKQRLLHEKIHYNDWKQCYTFGETETETQCCASGETETEARTLEILARMARDGDMLAKLSLFASLENDAQYFLLQNADTESNIDLLYKLDNIVNNLRPSEIRLDNPFYQFATTDGYLQDQVVIKYNANVFADIYPVIAGTMTSDRFEALGSYAGNLFSERFNQIQHRDDVVASLEQRVNFAYQQRATASSYRLYQGSVGVVFADGTEEETEKYDESQVPGAVVDEKDSCWRSGKEGEGQWWQVDLGQDRSIKYFALTPGYFAPQGSWLNEFKMLASPTGTFGGEEQVVVDEKNFPVTQVFSPTNPFEQNASVLYELPEPVNTRYLRIVSNIPNAEPEISELAVYAP